MNKKYCILGLYLILGVIAVPAQKNDNHRFELSKNMDIFNALIKDLDMFYVDTIHPEILIPDGIEMMLSKLDPYTNYMSEQDLGDFKFLVTGEYGGIGSVITQRNGKTYIVEPYEGMPAALAGLKAGDEILSIDDVLISEIKEPSEKLKGQPGTKVKLKYLRPGNTKPSTMEVTRKIIQVNPVTYYGVVGNNTGYIYLSGFTDQCSQEVKAAFLNLKAKNVSSVILDLRNNLGGSMEEAVQIVNFFVPKGKIVLTTKGKIRQADRTSRTTLDPLDAEIPLAILVNESSASASEIVCGAIQDMDRGILVGNRTFGKGLVQEAHELPYNTSLKLTTAKYYIPSGRCIQAIDYSHKAADGSVGAIPDSLTSVFYTEKGRPVRDGGGVTPDFKIEDQRRSSILYYLLVDYVVFDYVTEWVQKHPVIAPADQFVFPDADYDSFKAFAKEKDFKYNRQSEKALAALKEIVSLEGYSDDVSTEFNALEDKLRPNIDKELDENKDIIVRYISQEIAKRYYYQKGEILQTIKNDPALEKALEVLNDKELYQNTLTTPGNLSELQKK